MKSKILLVYCKPEEVTAEILALKLNAEPLDLSFARIYEEKGSGEFKIVENGSNLGGSSISEFEISQNLLLLDRSIPSHVVDALVNRRDSIAYQTGYLPFFLCGVNVLESSKSALHQDDRFIWPANSQREIDLRIEELKASRAKGPILLVGETGTGKTVAARRIHKNLRVAGAPFGQLGPTELRNQLRDATLRGVVKGAATNVDECNSIFVQNDGGTLFFDDFQDLDSDTQAALLGLVERDTDRVSGRKLGAKKSEDIWSARVQTIFAVNLPLSTLISEKLIRPDLLYRIPASQEIPLQPLRQMFVGGINSEKLQRLLLLRLIMEQEEILRKRQISLMEMASFFGIDRGARRLSEKLELKDNSPGEGAFEGRNYSLLTYQWPGNFRQFGDVADSLLQKSKMVGFWNSSDLGYALHCQASRSPVVPSSNLDSNWGSLSPQRLTALGFKKSFEMAENLRELGEFLGIDRRTAQHYLYEIVQNLQNTKTKSLKYVLTNLSDEEKNEIFMYSQRLLKKITLQKKQ